MSKFDFYQPVFMRKKHSIERIASLDDALELLEEWPHDQRDLVYETIYAACVRARHGHFPLAAVRENFRKFINRAQLLAEDDATILLPAQGNSRSVSNPVRTCATSESIK